VQLNNARSFGRIGVVLSQRFVRPVLQQQSESENRYIRAIKFFTAAMDFGREICQTVQECLKKASLTFGRSLQLKPQNRILRLKVSVSVAA